MNAIGIDLGGTKIETQIFDDLWAIVDKRRVATPETYAELVTTLAQEIRWAQGTDTTVPIGIGAAGLIDKNGFALTANLPATGHPIEQDLATALGRPVVYLNDCRTFTMSEAIFGAGRGYKSVVGVILGTGVGGGIAIDGHLASDPRSIGGEIGHIAAPASVIMDHGLGVFPCGCGRAGCYESYISGPGLSRICQKITGQVLDPIEITQNRYHDPRLEQVWNIWCDIVAEMFVALNFAIEPNAFVIGGGLSKIANLETDLAQAFDRRTLPGFRQPDIRIAQGGDSSGARGAAYAAWAAQNGDPTQGDIENTVGTIQ